LVEDEGKQPAKRAAVKGWMQRRRVERLVAQVTMHKALNRKLRGEASGFHITAASLRGSLRVVGRRLQSMANEGLLVGKDQNALLFVANITKNLAKTKGPRGNRHNALTQAVMGVLRKVGGERVHTLLSQNIGGLPCESTSRSFMHGEPFNAHLRDADFERIAGVYGMVMDRLGLPRGSIPCLVGEDETAINPNPQWDPAQDAAIGFCDVDCDRKCVKVTTCRSEGVCPRQHSCKWEGDFVVSMAGDYEEVQRTMRQARVGTLARAMVINPLHPGLPRLVCL
jgi:hypothetical protein